MGADRVKARGSARGRPAVNAPHLPVGLVPRLTIIIDSSIAPSGGRRSASRYSRSSTASGESSRMLADQIDPIRESFGPVSLAYLPAPDGVDLRLTVRDVESARADVLLEDASSAIRARLGRSIYAEGSTDLAAVILDRCRALHLTIAVAESCTGGLLGARLTSIPGSSDVVLGGVISYANDVKRDLLDVDREAARCPRCGERGGRATNGGGGSYRLRASIGIGITGIAGPGGGTPEKPVGTVWIALALKEGTRARRSGSSATVMRSGDAPRKARSSSCVAPSRKRTDRQKRGPV